MIRRMICWGLGLIKVIVNLYYTSVRPEICMKSVGDCLVVNTYNIFFSSDFWTG